MIADDLQIRDVQQRLKSTLECQHDAPITKQLKSPSIILYQKDSKIEHDLQIGTLSITIIEVRQVAKWDMRITLPINHSMYRPRLECKVPNQAAADLLRHVYQLLGCHPTTPVSEATLSRDMEEHTAAKEMIAL
jgi:hypothetical protein